MAGSVRDVRGMMPVAVTGSWGAV